MCSTPPATTTSAAPSAISPAPDGDGGQRPGAHPVEREPGHGVRDPREQRDRPAERQSLVADLRGRGEDDVADPLGREPRIAAQELAHDLDGHVVGARSPEHALRPGAPERGADAVDVDDFASRIFGESRLCSSS